MSVLCIIPARGGSKGIPRKNLRAVGGRSLIERAIKTAQQSGVCDHILVTTDDPEMRDIALSHGAQAPFLRPVELASDQAPMIPVLIHAIESFEKSSSTDIDTIVLTEVTVPFRKPEHIAQAVSRYRESDVRSVIGVCPLERKPHNIFIKKDSGLLERLFKDAPVFTRRQDMDMLCRLSSTVYVVGKKDLLQHKKLIIDPVAYVEVDAFASINIDHEIDLLTAEVIANKYDL